MPHSVRAIPALANLVARCALSLSHSLVEHSSSTLPCIPSGPTLGQLWQSAALVLRYSPVLVLGCLVLVGFLAWLSRRVVMDSAQPLRRSVAIWCSSSAHRARSTCSSLCTAWRSTIFSDPRRFALFFVHLVAYACPYMCLHVFHLGVYSRFPLCLFDHISQPFSGGMVYLFFIFSRGCYSKLLFADYRGGMVLVSKVSINTSR